MARRRTELTDEDAEILRRLFEQYGYHELSLELCYLDLEPVIKNYHKDKDV